MENLLLESIAEKFAGIELQIEAISQVVGSTNKTVTEIEKGLSLLVVEIRKRPSDLQLAPPATNTQPRFIVTETKRSKQYSSLVSLPMIVSALTMLLLCMFLTAGLRAVVVIAESPVLRSERTVPITSVPKLKPAKKGEIYLKSFHNHPHKSKKKTLNR